MEPVRFWLGYILYTVTLVVVLIIFETGYHYELSRYFSNFGKSDLTKLTSNKKSSDSGQQNDPIGNIEIKLSPGLLSKIQKGGYTIFVRHADRPQHSSTFAFDRIAMAGNRQKDLIITESGVCLSDLGKEESKLLGKIWNILNIPVGKVYSSPICRAVETAKYSLGKIDAISVGFVFDSIFASEEEKEKRTKIGKELLLKKPKTGTNNFIFSHTSTLQNLGITNSAALPQAGAAILEHKNDNEIEYIITLGIKDFADAVPIFVSTQDYDNQDLTNN